MQPYHLQRPRKFGRLEEEQKLMDWVQPATVAQIMTVPQIMEPARESSAALMSASTHITMAVQRLISKCGMKLYK